MSDVEKVKELLKKSSNDTALYLLRYSNRMPARYTMTFPKGYNTPSLKQENIIILNKYYGKLYGDHRDRVALRQSGSRI